MEMQLSLGDKSVNQNLYLLIKEKEKQEALE